MASVSHPLFDRALNDINKLYHRHLIDTEPPPPTESNNIAQDAKLQIDTPKANTDQTNNDIHQVNDLDDVLELQIHSDVVQREQEQQTQIAAEHHEYNVLKLYVLVIIFACVAIMLVSKWGRTKLLEYAHRLGIDSICFRIYGSISRSMPLLTSINNNDITINIQTPSNKPNPRKKLHIKDPSESEKLISSTINETRTKELFEPTLFGGDSSILTSQNAQLLHSWLPIRYNWLDWKMLYNLSVDGSSMLTFHDKCKGEGALIMIIKDDRGYIFGVFIAQSQGLNSTKRFFGGAETFVFMLYPNANKYEWTKINRFFVYFDFENMSNAAITIGGGKSPALSLLSNLSKGISQKCDTFNNPQLSSSEEFNCISLEVWTLIDYK